MSKRKSSLQYHMCHLGGNIYKLAKNLLVLPIVKGFMQFSNNLRCPGKAICPGKSLSQGAHSWSILFGWQILPRAFWYVYHPQFWRFYHL